MNNRPISLTDLLPPGVDPNDLSLLPCPEIIRQLSSEQKASYIKLTKRWITLTRDDLTQRNTAKTWLRALTSQTHSITLTDAVEVAQLAEKALSPTYHIALAGSCLTKGHSFNDIDLKVYPHNGDFGLTNVTKTITSILVKSGWSHKETLGADEVYTFTYIRLVSPTGFPVELSFIVHI